MKVIFTISLLAGALSVLSAAESTPIGPTLSFSVTCRPSEKQWVENFFRLALRHQAVSTAERGDFHLWIVVQPTGVSNTSTGYHHSGYAVGYVLTRPIPTNLVVRSYDGIGSHQAIQQIFPPPSTGHMEFLLQGVETCFLGDLQQVCESVVKLIDSAALGVERQRRESRYEAKKVNN